MEAVDTETASCVRRTLIVEQPTVPPDGGWGWVVVFAGLICHLVIDGIVYSFGIFFNDFLQYYGEGYATTSWIASILIGSYLISSPIASGLTIRYGCRRISIVGAFLSAFGLFISIYSPNIVCMFITFGFITGTGFGFTLLPAVVCVTSYFDKRRSLATGITVCGSGLGTFIMAPLLGTLLELYGWQGALIIASGLSLQCVVAGALLRPLRPSQFCVVSQSSESSVATNNTRHRPLPVYDVTNKVDPETTRPCMTLNLIPDEEQPDTQSFHSHIRLRKDLFFEASLPDDYQPTVSFFSTESTALESSRKESQVVQLVDNRNRFLRFICSYEMAAAFEEMMNFQLLRNPLFAIFALSRVCCGLGYTVPYLFIRNHAIDALRLEEMHASTLLSGLGISNVMGRVLVGLLSDKAGDQRVWLYIACVMTCGLSTVLCVLCTSYDCLLAYCIVYGAAGGGFITISTVFIVDLVGMDHLTNAYGLSLLSLGVAALVGPPINGWIHDITNSYVPGFMFAGVMLYGAGVLLISVPWLQNRTVKQQRRRVSFSADA
ncbi:monocarboxylate transporter 10-like isoform X1 [Ornithodoros turicata]|uniref:monocarboxylate transporter 10-like isoform X1 n=1 Tax=Ornithodoros turicata TaxID=34597 RepID=UPI0031389C05